MTDNESVTSGDEEEEELIVVDDDNPVIVEVDRNYGVTNYDADTEGEERDKDRMRVKKFRRFRRDAKREGGRGRSNTRELENVREKKKKVQFTLPAASSDALVDNVVMNKEDEEDEESAEVQKVSLDDVDTLQPATRPEEQVKEEEERPQKRETPKKKSVVVVDSLQSTPTPEDELEEKKVKSLKRGRPRKVVEEETKQLDSRADNDSSNNAPENVVDEDLLATYPTRKRPHQLRILLAAYAVSSRYPGFKTDRGKLICERTNLFTDSVAHWFRDHHKRVEQARQNKDQGKKTVSNKPVSSLSTSRSKDEKNKEEKKPEMKRGRSRTRKMVGEPVSSRSTFQPKGGMDKKTEKEKPEMRRGRSRSSTRKMVGEPVTSRSTSQPRGGMDKKEEKDKPELRRGRSRSSTRKMVGEPVSSQSSQTKDEKDKKEEEPEMRRRRSSSKKIVGEELSSVRGGDAVIAKNRKDSTSVVPTTKNQKMVNDDRVEMPVVDSPAPQPREEMGEDKETPQRKRGRPRKMTGMPVTVVNSLPSTPQPEAQLGEDKETPMRKRGRPRKVTGVDLSQPDTTVDAESREEPQIDTVVEEEEKSEGPKISVKKNPGQKEDGMNLNLNSDDEPLQKKIEQKKGNKIDSVVVVDSLQSTPEDGLEEKKETPKRKRGRPRKSTGVELIRHNTTVEDDSSNKLLKELVVKDKQKVVNHTQKTPEQTENKMQFNDLHSDNEPIQKKKKENKKSTVSILDSLHRQSAQLSNNQSEEKEETPIKRKRGRPRKSTGAELRQSTVDVESSNEPKDTVVEEEEHSVGGQLITTNKTSEQVENELPVVDFPVFTQQPEDHMEEMEEKPEKRRGRSRKMVEEKTTQHATTTTAVDDESSNQLLKKKRTRSRSVKNVEEQTTQHATAVDDNESSNQLLKKKRMRSKSDLPLFRTHKTSPQTEVNKLNVPQGDEEREHRKKINNNENGMNIEPNSDDEPLQKKIKKEPNEDPVSAVDSVQSIPQPEQKKNDKRGKENDKRGKIVEKNGMGIESKSDDDPLQKKIKKEPNEDHVSVVDSLQSNPQPEGHVKEEDERQNEKEKRQRKKEKRGKIVKEDNVKQETTVDDEPSNDLLNDSVVKDQEEKVVQKDNVQEETTVDDESANDLLNDSVVNDQEDEVMEKELTQHDTTVDDDSSNELPNSTVVEDKQKRDSRPKSRVMKTPKQLKVLLAAFDIDPSYPRCKTERCQRICIETGLTHEVVSKWFSDHRRRSVPKSQRKKQKDQSDEDETPRTERLTAIRRDVPMEDSQDPPSGDVRMEKKVRKSQEEKQKKEQINVTTATSLTAIRRDVPMEEEDSQDPPSVDVRMNEKVLESQEEKKKKEQVNVTARARSQSLPAARRDVSPMTASQDSPSVGVRITKEKMNDILRSLTTVPEEVTIFRSRNVPVAAKSADVKFGLRKRCGTYPSFPNYHYPFKNEDFLKVTDPYPGSEYNRKRFYFAKFFRGDKDCVICGKVRATPDTNVVSLNDAAKLDEFLGGSVLRDRLKYALHVKICQVHRDDYFAHQRAINQQDTNQQ